MYELLVLLMYSISAEEESGIQSTLRTCHRLYLDCLRPPIYTGLSR